MTDTSIVTNASLAVSNAASSAKRASNSAFALDDLIALRTEHDAWFAGTYKASNDELYGLLAKCLGIYQRMTGQRIQIAAFATECVTRGLKFKKTTSLIHRIVKYVFGIDSKRVSRYAIALTVAHDDKVDPMNLHTWIASQRGIEEIQAKKSGRLTTRQRAKQYVDKGLAAADALNAQDSVKFDDFSMVDAASPYLAVLARINANGVIELLTPISDETVVNAALAAYGVEVAKKADEDRQQAEIVASNDRVASVLAA